MLSFVLTLQTNFTVFAVFQFHKLINQWIGQSGLHFGEGLGKHCGLWINIAVRKHNHTNINRALVAMSEYCREANISECQWIFWRTFNFVDMFIKSFPHYVRFLAASHVFQNAFAVSN